MAVIASVILNAVFLVGTWRYGQLRLGADGPPLTTESFNEFFLTQAKEWKISSEDARRVRSVVDDAIETGLMADPNTGHGEARTVGRGAALG